MTEFPKACQFNPVIIFPSNVPILNIHHLRMSNNNNYKKTGRALERRMNKYHTMRMQDIIDGTAEPVTTSLSERGSILYFKSFYNHVKANSLLAKLKDQLHPMALLPSHVTSSGCTVQQPRMSIWFGPHPYSYSRYTLQNHSFQECLALSNMRDDMEFVFGGPLNSCLVNIYRNGMDSVAWHADDEELFGPDPTIVSVSLGATRTFELCTNTLPHTRRFAQYSYELVHGAVLVMKGDIQKNWVHRVPRQHSVNEERWNFTFRSVI